MAEVLQVASVGIVGLLGLWLGNSYRRRLRIQLTEHVLLAYRRLWEATGVSPANRKTLLTAEEREALVTAMQEWYFADGNGMLLPAPTRNLFSAVRDNLGAQWREMQPPGLVTYMEGLPPDETEEVAACACNRHLSVLRSQMKNDLAFYSGGTHLRALRPDELELVRSCGIAPRRLLGRVPWLKPSRDTINPCACRRCPGNPSPLDPASLSQDGRRSQATSGRRIASPPR